MDVQIPQKIIHKIIPAQANFPGNTQYPLLIYQQVYPDINELSPSVQSQLGENDWKHSWVDSIYDFHHYHANTHEVLVIIAGTCEVQFGGEHGPIYTVNIGDVVIIPAGVAHKSMSKSHDFQCIGAYPFDVQHDMSYGTNEEAYSIASEMIKELGLPKKDPIFGEKGLLFNYWK